MRLFDTLSGEKKELVQPKRFGIFKRPINLFVCGPTVYDYPHIGNARTFVFFDMFVKYLRSQGYSIFYLQNITNVDDKIIQRAIDEKTTWDAVAKKFEDAFFDYNKRLNITSVDKFARSTEFIPQVIAQVQTLIKKGNAYKIEGDGWYFDLKTFPAYGKLSRRTIEQAQTSAEQGTSRVDNSDNKRNAGDFCLWKFVGGASDESQVASEEKFKVIDGIPAWYSELGWGRPGWHIEDTATTEHFFGPQYDIHGGALDLKFPHHEAELTQQEAASGKSPFVQFWMHAGFLTVDGKKMSKSLGNFMTVDDVLKKMTADEFRMMLLMHHYRQPLDFTEEKMLIAKKSFANLQALIAKLSLVRNSIDSEKIAAFIDQFKKDFKDSMDDDFNTPRAGAAIGILETGVNTYIRNISAAQAKEITNLFTTVLSAFGITLTAPHIPEEIQKLVQERELSRASKQFAQSDALRQQIEQLGYVVEDGPAGPVVLPKS